MGFVIGLLGLVVAYFTWDQRYTDVTFDGYIKEKLGKTGGRWKFVFWVAVCFCVFSMLVFNAVPAYVGLLVFLAIWVVWLSSPAGQQWLKTLA